MTENFVPLSLCSIEGEGGGEGGGGGGAAVAGSGGAADLLAGAGGDGGAGAAGAGAAAAGAEGGAAGADPDWLQHFSADPDGDKPANRDWLKAKGFKSLDDVIRSHREAEATILNGGKLTVPGENAKPEEIAAFRKAIGVPENVDGYEIKVPDGAELDAGFVGPMKERALKNGTPAAAFNDLAQGFIEWQQDQLNTLKTNEDADAQGWIKAQGDQKDAKLVDVQRAMKALDLSPQDVAGIQRGLGIVNGKPGSARTLDLLAKLGAGMAEDVLIGGGKGKFGITGAEAQAEVDRLIADKDFQTKLTAKDPTAVARWNRLNEAIAAARDAEERRAATA